MNTRVAHSVDPDETARHEPSHLDLHCLQRYLYVFVCGDERVRLFDLCLFGFVGFLFLLGRAAVCDCGTPWTFLLPLFFFK